MTTETNQIPVGGKTRLRVYGKIAAGIQADSDRIFSWYINATNENSAVATVAWTQLTMPGSDSPVGGTSTSSRGTVDGGGCLGIRNTFLKLPMAGKEAPVLLFEVEVTGLTVGEAHFNVEAGTGAAGVQYDFQVARLGGGVPFTGGNYANARAVLYVGRSPPAKPVISAEPSDRVVTAGVNTNLSMTVTGTAPLSYRWFFEGSELPGANAATLILNGVDATDAGGYRAIVSNAAGSATSRIAQLTVNRRAQTISFAAVANRTLEDPPLVLSGSASSGLPVSFAVFSGPAVIQGSTLTPTGTGQVTVMALQSGDAIYLEATPVSRTFTVTAQDPPSIAIGNASQLEHNSGSSNMLFTVSLSKAATQIVSVDFATGSGTAAAGVDYVGTLGKLTFQPGVRTQYVTVQILGDMLDEAVETFEVTLSTPLNAVLADATGVGTIQNDDPAPTISISDAVVIEGQSGTVDAIFTVTLSSPSGRQVAAAFATANGTATAGADYVAATGTVSFEPGITSRTIVVKVSGDLLNEAAEQFVMNLSALSNASAGDLQGAATIQDDDALPALVVDSALLQEGASGTGNMQFTVRLSAASGRTVTVSFSSANGSAQAGADYVSTNGTLTFAAGVLTQFVTVRINGDLAHELDETLELRLSNPVNASIATALSTGTIRNDDPEPTFSIGDVSVSEGNSGSANLSFAVVLSAASGLEASVEYGTGGGTATAGMDYTPSFGKLTFATGVRTQLVAIAIVGDSLNEANETFQVNLSKPLGATVADGQASGTIVNDDPEPVISISDVAVAEGDAGTVDATFIVSLSTPSGQIITANYATVDGTANGGVDFTGVTGTLTFQPGNLNQLLIVKVAGDNNPEPNETFSVVLSALVRAGAGKLSGTGTIFSDDSQAADPPIPVEDQVVAGKDASRTMLSGDLLSNDTGTGPLQVTAIVTTMTKGQVVNHGDGTITYNPSGKFDQLLRGQTGSDSFDYVVTDSLGASATGRVNITIIWTAKPVVERIQMQGGTHAVTLSGLPGVRYRVESKDDLNQPAWVQVDVAKVVGLDRTAQFVDSRAQSRLRFYRARVE